MNLTTGKHQPYKKPGDTPLYVHVKSNHPPSILKNIPENINKRISSMSSDQETFNKVAHTYQEALQKSGYRYTMKYIKPEQKATKRIRKCNITWYNPPFSKNVQTNIGRKFLQIMKKNFHSRHPLYKIFNSNTIKLSYSCMSNIRNIVTNRKGKNKTQVTDQSTCNCRREMNAH